MTYRVGKYTLPEYSVLMSVYDRELPENLNESLESMLMQSYPPSDFVLVCDGKLTCELNIIVKSFQDEFKHIFHIVQIDQRPEKVIPTANETEQCYDKHDGLGIWKQNAPENPKITAPVQSGRFIQFFWKRQEKLP